MFKQKNCLSFPLPSALNWFIKYVLQSTIVLHLRVNMNINIITRLRPDQIGKACSLFTLIRDILFGNSPLTFQRPVSRTLRWCPPPESGSPSAADMWGSKHNVQPYLDKKTTLYNKKIWDNFFLAFFLFFSCLCRFEDIYNEHGKRLEGRRNENIHTINSKSLDPFFIGLYTK